MTSSSSKSEIHLRYMVEGRASTLHFEQPLQDGHTLNYKRLSHVGTDSCIFCVGVYFPINHRTSPSSPANPEGRMLRCFLAHIYADMVDVNSDRQTCVPEFVGENIREMTLGALEAEAEREKWTREDVDIERMVIVCPQYHVDPEREASAMYVMDGKMSGHWVVQAIKEFLGLSADPAVDTESQGFVVDHGGSGNVLKISKGLHPREIEEGWYEDIGIGKTPYCKHGEPGALWKFRHIVRRTDV